MTMTPVSSHLGELTSSERLALEEDERGLDRCPTCSRRINDFDPKGCELESGQRWCLVHLPFATRWRLEHPDDAEAPAYPEISVIRDPGDASILILVSEFGRDRRFPTSQGELWLRDEVEAQELHDRLQELLEGIGCELTVAQEREAYRPPVLVE